jgi:demethylmenaquinone methyltransferase/2-methoxy-6-polyprenyl-1,4-benzoquinol methylase
LENRGTQFVFDPIAGRYDCCNRLFSLGLDRRWRKALVRAVGAASSERVLDVCCGTGDVVFDFLRHSPVRRIDGVDISESMLYLAQEKQMLCAGKRCMANSAITWLPADAAQLPYETKTFDAVTCAFGIRNVSDRQAALSEAYRVLKPAGRIGILEFSVPANPLLRFFYLTYLTKVMPAAGFILLRRKAPLKYLADSIVNWHHNVHFTQELEHACFGDIRQMPLTSGIVTLWLARKPAGLAYSP